MSTLSRTTSSCDRRLATSGAGPPTSLVISSILRPATVSPCIFMYVRAPFSIWLAASANWPDSVSGMPILTVCACAAPKASARADARASFFIRSSSLKVCRILSVGFAPAQAGIVMPPREGAEMIGFIGLGVMGEPICRQLATKSGQKVVAYDVADEPLERLVEHGVQPCNSVAVV